MDWRHKMAKAITYPDQNHTQPKIMQYSVSVQTQLPANVVLQIAYVGNKASQLEINKSIDALPAQYYNQGAAGVTFLADAGYRTRWRVAPRIVVELCDSSKTVLATSVPRIYQRNGQLCVEGERAL